VLTDDRVLTVEEAAQLAGVERRGLLACSPLAHRLDSMIAD
jgi:hypothetical protein